MNSFDRHHTDFEEHAGLRLLPLSVAQRGLWIAHKIAPPDAVVNIAECLEIHGAVDEELFLRAMYQLAAEAETARVAIVEQDGVPYQAISDRFDRELPFVDVSAAPDPRAAAFAWMMDELSRPVDLARDPLWVIALVKAGPEKYFWMHRCHHIVLDGFSGGLIARRMSELYCALVENREPEPCDFGHFAEINEHEARYRASPRFERDRQYWMEHLADLPEPISLSRRRGQATGGLQRATGHLSAELTARLQELAKARSVSLPQALISLLAAYIHRATGSEDLVLGMPVTARTNAALRRVPGLMANAVTIRLAMSPRQTLDELMQQTGKTVLHALRHQQYRFEDVRRDLGLTSDNRQISWTAINIEPFHYDLRFGDATSTPHNLSNGSIEDITIFVYDRNDGQGLRIDVDANPGLYDMDELNAHLTRLNRLVEAAVAAPDAPLSGFDILDPEERALMAGPWNDTRHDVPDAPWIDLFEARAQKTPDAPAVVVADRAVGYAALDAAANRLAHVLKARGIGPGSLVAVALPRDEHLVTTLIAIHKAGGAYLPLDAGAPPARLAMTFEDAAAALMVTTSEIAAALPEGAPPLFLLDKVATGGQPATAPERGALSGADTAYVIFTSGSTGRPKGVVIPHRALTNCLLTYADFCGIGPGDRLMAVTTIAFDIAALELFMPLAIGAAVIVAPRDVVRDPRLLALSIQAQKATVMQATPSLWQALLADHLESVKGLKAMVGGEALPGALARLMRELGGPVLNLYGPTETTIWSTAMALDGGDLDSPPIGRPVWNTTVHVLDKSMQRVPVGVPGDLYIGGLGLADGYLNRPELTAERFVADPFCADPLGGGRLYKTGDIARWREDGVLEYLGRSDFQIKIRGFRVEAGEIESALLALDGIERAVVILREEPGRGKMLVAYLVGAVPEAGELRARLAERLPDYMIPAAFVTLDALPLSINGKLDRAALPKPEWQDRAAYVAPRTPTEETLATLWAEIFEVEKVGIHDNLFDLGGDSIQAARMISTLQARFALEIPLGAVFTKPTIAGLAEEIEKAADHDPFTPLLTLQSSGSGAPLFCIHPVVGLGWSYAGLLRHVKDRPVHVLQVPGLSSPAPLYASIPDMARDYLAQIRAIQPHGPYHMLGWSFGGLVAQEIAHLLEAEGESVAFLCMLDSYTYVQGKTRTEAEDVRAALAYVGHDIDDPPETLSALADHVCALYDVYSIPLVQSMGRKNPALFDNMRAAIANNLQLAQSFAPHPLASGSLAQPALLIRATEGKTAAMDDIVHHQPDAWDGLIGTPSVLAVACHHHEMMETGVLADIGPVIADHLARAAEQAATAAA
ncbi:amino acid adenylation domain-containing protein [Zavarzinia compransoris]|uniref:amino acid adenylation domain-containing protein n=1 Tax=Zavarzinia marina TaxID=2911065 RepID=UPI001F2F4F96|nr:amino acid adenylation domain-containing protein [Zavarzinia marina]MCF4166898.1 amino acid adenylation domain-containing protein [Zavarzinia marina]